tara:strand:+ start:47 stop:808 length:762 start_codon:yes stop_codon:yes gene_type:complete
MEQDGHQLQSEIKTPIGNHVLVDYTAGTFGDWLRYFISEHDGFEKLNFETENEPGFLKLKLDAKKVSLNNIKTTSDFIKEFEKTNPNFKNNRQCYKIRHVQSGHESAGHSCVGANWLEDGSILDGKVFKWDYTNYNLIRETDHKIVIIVLSPFSKYKDLYMKRHKIWKQNLNPLGESWEWQKDTNEEYHELVWQKNYIKNNYPKHKLNYQIEINNLLDKDDETYYSLIKFLDVKPIEKWKYYVDDFEKLILSK